MKKECACRKPLARRSAFSALLLLGQLLKRKLFLPHGDLRSFRHDHRGLLDTGHYSEDRRFALYCGIQPFVLTLNNRPESHVVLLKYKIVRRKSKTLGIFSFFCWINRLLFRFSYIFQVVLFRCKEFGVQRFYLSAQ